MLAVMLRARYHELRVSHVNQQGLVRVMKEAQMLIAALNKINQECVVDVLEVAVVVSYLTYLMNQ